MTELARNFIITNPSDEEMSRFLEEHYKLRHLVHDDIIEIIKRMQDEENKHKTILKYAQGDVLFFKRDDLLNIIVNMRNLEISKMTEYIIIDRLRNQREKDREHRGKQISHSIYGYLSSLEQLGREKKDNNYIERVKELFDIVARMFEKVDLLSFLFNMDMGQWDRNELYKYEQLLKPEEFGELLEEWQEAQKLKSKIIVNKAFEEAEKEGLSIESITIDFLESAKDKGLQMDKLYEWIIRNNSGALIIEQRAEMQEGLTILNGKEQKQPDKND